MQYSPSLTRYHCILPPFYLEWQVPLGPGFGHWEAYRHSSAPSAAQGGGKIHKPTRSAGSEQNLLRVPFLLESQARPGERDRKTVRSHSPGGESTNTPRAIRVGKRTFIYGGLELVSKGTRALQLCTFVPGNSFIFIAAVRNHQTSDSWLPQNGVTTLQYLQMFTRYKRAERDKAHVLAQRNLLFLALFSQKSKAAGAAGGSCADPSSPASPLGTRGEAGDRSGTSAKGTAVLIFPISGSSPTIF